jgi:hypothetical protein
MAFGSDIGLGFKITADSKQAQNEIKELRSAFDKELRAIKQSGTNSFLSLGQSAGLSAKQMASVVASTVAVGGAAIAAGASIFALAKQASDLGSKFYDISQKTSVSVETISSLRVAADKSSSSIEEVAQGLVIFERNLAKAGENKVLEKSLTDLGIRIHEGPEVALSDFLKVINSMPEGTERTALAVKLFGRSGASLIPTFLEVGGNLDAFKDKVKAAGEQMSTATAKDMDKFGDRLTDLSLRVEGMSTKIGVSLIPSLNDLINELEKAGAGGKEQFDIIDFTIGNVIRGVAALVDGFRQLYEYGKYVSPLQPLVDSYYKLAPYFQSAVKVPDASTTAPTTTQTSGSQSNVQQNAALKSALDQQGILLQSELKKEQRLYDEHKVSLEAYTKRRIELAQEAHRIELQQIAVEREALESADAKTEQQQEDVAKKRIELTTREAKAEAKLRDDIADAQVDRRKKEEDAEREHRATLQSLSAKYDLDRITAIRDLAEQNVITNEQAEERIATILEGGFEKRRKYLEQERDAAGEDLQLRQKYNNQLEELEQERTAALAEQARKRRDALKQDLDEQIEQRANFFRRDDELWQIRDERDRRRFEEQRATGFLKEADYLQQLSIIEQAAMVRREDATIEEFKLLLSAREDYGEKAKDLTLKELLNLEAKTEREKDLQRQLIVAEMQRAAAVEEASKRIFAARIREGEPLPPPKPFELTIEQQRGNILSDKDLADIGAPPPPNFDAWHHAFDLLKQSGLSAFKSLGQGIGGLIQTFLSGGKVGAGAFAALAKSIAASLAAQALVEAAMELAYAYKEHALGVAALANPLTAWQAPAHFAAGAAHLAAAGAFGLIGGIAAGAALLIPGGRSSGQSQATAGGTTAGTTGGTNTTPQPQTITEERGPIFQPQQPQVVHHVYEIRTTHEIVAQDGFVIKQLKSNHSEVHRLVEDHILSNINNGGRLRERFLDLAAIVA